MKKVDRLIREALSEEEAHIFEEMEKEQSIFHDLIELYQGRYRWLLALWTIATVGLVVVVVFGTIQFLNATEVRTMLIWGAAVMACLMAISGIKIFSWMEIHRNSLMRELKRLELQVAYLAGSLPKSNTQT